MGFGVTTLVLSVFNCGAVKIPNLILGLAFFYGGLAQLLAGMWEFASGNTFGATAFSSYAAFWLSFAYIYVPQSGILAAYMGGPGGEAELRRALGLYLLGWLIFTVVMFFATWRSTIGLVLLLGFLSLTFFFLMIAEFTNNYGCKVTGGVLGVITACIAIYDAMHVLITHETSHFRIPNKNLSKKNVMEGTAGTTGTAGAAGNPPMKGTAAAGQDIANVA
jgi:succinate-acetate transporter protein